MRAAPAKAQPSPSACRWPPSDRLHSNRPAAIHSPLPAGPTFVWNDISGTGTAIFGQYEDDDNYGPQPIGFDFNFSVPGLSDITRRMGTVPASQRNADVVLAAGARIELNPSGKSAEGGRGRNATSCISATQPGVVSAARYGSSQI